MQMGMGESYRLALQLARDSFGHFSAAALQARCRECGAEFSPLALPPAGPPPTPPPSPPPSARAGPTAGSLRVVYLGQPHTITFPDGEVRGPGNTEVPMWLMIILLHYLNGPSAGPVSAAAAGEARGGPAPGGGAAGGPAARASGGAEGELIPFRNLTGGRVYLPNFEKRVLQRLVREFGQAPEKMVQAGETLGGDRVSFGDAGLRLWPLPRVPLTFVLWAADDEFPAQANVLFDSTVENYLCTEDAIVLCEQVTSTLVGTARRLGGVV